MPTSISHRHDILPRDLGSIDVLICGDFQSHVGPAKAGVEILMKNLALEWGPYGNRTNSVVTGFIADTEGMRRISSQGGGEAFENYIPLRRMGRVEEIGQAAAFLGSPLAAYITGTPLWIDGGQGLAGSSFFNTSSATFLEITKPT